MIIEYIKEYTRASGRPIKIGQLSEVDNVLGNQLIAEGYARLYAQNTAEVGCDAMLKNHLGGMRENVQHYDEEE